MEAVTVVAEVVLDPPPAAAPEPGQLARVRGRMWVVAGATRDAQAARDGRAVQHLVSLVSVEDDGGNRDHRFGSWTAAMTLARPDHRG